MARRPFESYADAFRGSPKRIAEFKAYLVERGAEVMAPTNPYEVVRFKAGGISNILYENMRGRFRANGPDLEAAFRDWAGRIGHWRAGARHARVKGSARSVLVRTLQERDGSDCFYCGLPLGKDETVEELLSIAQGGARTVANCALAHKACNNAAGHMSVVEKVALRDALLGYPRTSDKAAVVEYIGLVNELRARHGRPPLAVPEMLARAA
jgi:hypothetical protein